MSILVTGGTGTVGAALVKELAGRGSKVRVLTRDPAKVKPAKGVTAVQGDLLEPSTVRRVFDGIDAVFLLNAVGRTEACEALMANDYWFKDVLLQYGAYPQPLGSTGVSRVDVRDIAEAAAIALTTNGHAGQSYDLVGPEAVTGESTAKSWSAALGKPIAYAGDDLDAWEKQQLQYLPDWMVFDFRYMYEHFQKNGLIASGEAIRRQTKLLGHAPRGFDAFAQETAAAWR